jgi:hypothetical protein
MANFNLIILVLFLVFTITFTLTLLLVYKDKEIREEASSIIGLFNLILGVLAYVALMTAFVISLIMIL